MKDINIKNDSGLLALAVRLVIGWTYFSKGTYTLKITDISGVFWTHLIEK